MAESQLKTSPLIRTGKLDAQKATGQLFINLGCGHIPLESYINVDIRDLPGVDIVADAGDLPIQANSVSEIFSAHMLEHFPEELLRRRLLPYWRSLLLSEGVFRAVVPDGEAMLQGLSMGTYAFKDFREVLFGAQDYTGDFHYNLFAPNSLVDVLEEAGFNDVRILAKARKNGKCFEFEVQAIGGSQYDASTDGFGDYQHGWSPRQSERHA